MIPLETAAAPAIGADLDRPVILTKVRPPRVRRDQVSRTRLVDYLSANIDRKLILVSAAAGYGKTTMIVDFAAQSGIPACWYRLDDADTDLSVFFEHLIASLRQRYPGVCERTLKQLRTDQHPDPEVVVGSLINEITEQIDEFFLLVLDDFHKLDDSVLINAALDFFLRYLPDNCRVVVLSRTLPKKLTLTRLAGEGQVLGVGQEHLRFRPDEIGNLVKHLHHEELSSEEAEDLAARSEGWIAALVMGSEKLLDGVRTGLDLPAADRGQLFDYLAAEVVDKLDPDVSAFLLQTSILEAMTPDLCDVVTGRSESAAMLERLEEQNLFLVRMEGDERWYRYHDLFHDFLSARLDATNDPEVVDRHRRAATWYAEAGQPDMEILHLLEAGDFHDAAARIEAAMPDTMGRGRWRIVIRWITGLPEPVRRTRPKLLGQLAVAFAYLGRLPESVASAGQAIDLYSEQGNDEGMAASLLHRSYSWRFMSQIDAAMADASRALELTEHPKGWIASGAHRNLGACLSLKGDMAAAAEEFHLALTAFEEAGLSADAAHTNTDLSAMYQLTGDIRRSLHHAQRAKLHWEKVGNVGFLALTLNNMGTAYYAQGQLDEALHYLNESVQQARLVGVRRTEALAMAGKADVESDLDLFDDAIAHYNEALLLARETGEGTLVCYCLASLADTQRLSGDVARARQTLTEARDELTSNRSAYEAALVEYVRGTIALDELDPIRAAKHFDEAARSFGAMGALREQARVLLHQVAAAHRLGDMADADRYWRRALAVIKKFEFVAAFAPQVRRLPEVFARDGIRDASDTKAPQFAGLGAAPVVGVKMGVEGPGEGAALSAEAAGVALADSPEAGVGESADGAGPGHADGAGGHSRPAARDGSATPGHDAAPDSGAGGSQQAADGRSATTGSAATDGEADQADGLAPRSTRRRILAQAPAGPLWVRAFGVPQVKRGDLTVHSSDFETAAARELFFYLIDRPEGATRDDVLLSFWPESSLPKATSAFHSTLHRMRRVVGKGAIVHKGDRYFIHNPAGIAYDVAEFETALARADDDRGEEGEVGLLERATAHVAGRYLEGVQADWAIERGEALLAVSTGALMRQGALRLEAGDATAAVSAYQAVLRMDPLHEDAHRACMQALAKAGNRVKALQHYEQLVRLLASELGVEPDGRTQALYEAIRRQEGQSAA